MRSFESREDYLETILILHNEKGYVRSIDIAARMNFSKPSVSRAMGLLKTGGYILVDKDGFITLTDSGMEIAEKIFERHTILTKMLVGLGVDEETAAAIYYGTLSAGEDPQLQAAIKALK